MFACTLVAMFARVRLPVLMLLAGCSGHGRPIARHEPFAEPSEDVAGEAQTARLDASLDALVDSDSEGSGTDAALDEGESEGDLDGAKPVGGSGRQWVERVVAALEARSPTVRARNVMTPLWSWVELDLFDQHFPLSIDLIGSNLSAPRGVVYMLPGGAMNFRASFMIPPEDNLAHFFRRHGYLVVGITPREDAVPADTADTSFMQGWGMAKHREDIRQIVSLVQSLVPLSYELLGHSYGAAAALDYAAEYPGEARRVVALDIYSFDPRADETAMRRARRTHAAYVTLQREGVFADSSYADFPALVREGLGGPDAGGGRRWNDAYARYTSKQLLLFGMIYSAVLPGVHTDLTGLPGDWPMAMSTVAAEEGWQFRPSDDNRPFARTSLPTLLLVAEELGGGLIPMALARDYWSVVSMVEGGHPLRWGNIDGPVLWINSELGYHDQMYGSKLIGRASGARIETSVIAGYGHADMLWSRTAREDLWQRLLPGP